MPLSFKQFLTNLHESVDPIPHGVLEYNRDGKTPQYIVGVEHGTPASINNKELLSKIRDVGKKHGYYYEGSGGADDSQPLFNLSKPADYKGGWDIARQDKLRSFQPYMLSPLFGNVDKNWDTKTNSVKQTMGTSGNLIDGAQRFAKQAYPKLKISRQHVEDFFKQASEGTEYDFHDLAKNASLSEPDKVKDVMKKMEKIAWPSNWKESDRQTGPERLTDKNEEERNSYITDKSGPGVYFAGSGHLKEIEQLLKNNKQSYTMHGGSQIE